MAEYSRGAGLLMGGARYGGETDPYADLDLTSLSDEELDYLDQELARRETPWYQRGAVPGTEPPPEEPGFFGDVKDIGVQILAGVPKAGAGLVELGGMVPGLHYIADPIARGLMATGEYIEDIGLSDYQKQKSAELSEALDMAVGDLGPDADINDYADAIVAQGGAAAKYLAENPGQVLNLIAESLPYIAGGGVAVKGLQKGAQLAKASTAGELATAGRIKRGLGAAAATPGVRNVLQKVDELSPLQRGALGEGLMVTGTTVQGIAEATEDEGYTAGRLLAPLAGLGAYGTGRLGGKIAERLGMEGADIDTLVAQKLGGDIARKIDPVDVLGTTGFRDTPEALVRPLGQGRLSRAAGTASRMGVGGTLEGVVEELPQSVIEQVVTNVGAGRPALEDVGGAAVLGAAAGFGMGAPLGARRTRSMRLERAEQQARAAAPASEIRPETLTKPRGVTQEAFDAAQPELANATTRAEAEAVLRSEPLKDQGFVDRDGNLTSGAKKIIEQWQTVLGMTRPAGMPKSMWEAVEPIIGDARTQEAVELALRRDRGVSGKGDSRFVNSKGQLNKWGRQVVLQWQGRTRVAEEEGRRAQAAAMAGVAAEPTMPPEEEEAPAVGEAAPVVGEPQPAAPAVTEEGGAAPAVVTGGRRAAAPAAPTLRPSAGNAVPVPGYVKTSRPAYKSRSVIFASPVDKAAYIGSNLQRPSATQAQQLQYVMDVTGYTQEEAIQYGNMVRAKLAELEASTKSGALNVPDMQIRKERKAAKPAGDKEIVRAIQAKLDEEWDGASDDKAAEVSDEAAKKPAKKPVKKGERVSFSTPESRMALVLALQGYMPELIDPKLRRGTALGRLSKLSEELKALGPQGQELYDRLVNLHTMLKEREAQVRVQGKAEGITEAERKAAVAADKDLTKKIAAEYDAITTLVGKNNLNAALKASKTYMSTLLSKETGFLQGEELSEYQTTGLKGIGMDTSAGVRFSTEYRAFTSGEMGQQGIRTESYRSERTAKGLRIAGRRIKGKTQAEKYKKLNNLNARRRDDVGSPTRLADIVDKDIFNGKKQPRHRLEAYFDHMIQTGRTGYTKLLARRLKATAEALDLFNPRTPNRIKIVLSEDKDPRGRALGRVVYNEFYDPKLVTGANATQATMYIYSDGMDSVTVLHEAVHIVSGLAVRDRKFKNTQAYKQLYLVAQNLRRTKVSVEEVRAKYGASAASAYEVLTGFVAKSDTEKAVAEMLSYGFTETGLQKMLMHIKNSDGKLYRAELAPKRRDSLWNTFVNAIKSLFGLAAMRNTEFERFMYASNDFLMEIEEASGTLQSKRGRGELESLGAVEQNGDTPYDPEVAIQRGETAAAARAAKQKNVGGDAGITAKQREAAKKRAPKPPRTMTPEEYKRRNTTNVLATGRTNMDVTWLDNVERQALNWIASMFPRSSGDFGVDVQKLLDGGRDKLRKFLKSEPRNPIERVLQDILNTLGAGIVSGYGQPDSLREKLHKLSAAFYSLGAEFSVRIQDIGTLPRDQQAAILQYLETGDEAALKAAINDPRAAKSVLALAKRVEDLYAEAIKAGLLPKSLDTGNLRVIDFLELYNDPQKGKIVRQSVKDLELPGQLPTGVSTAVSNEEKVNGAFIDDQNGQAPVSLKNPTIRYWKVLDDEGYVHFIDTRMNPKAIKQRRYVPFLDDEGNVDSHKYRSRGVNSAGEVLMVRPRTQAELEAGKRDNYLDNVVNSLAILGQNWGRVLENHKFFDSMVAENASMKEEADKWILDQAPEGVPDNRVTELTKEEAKSIVELNKSMSTRMSTKLRAPGFWVTIPETASDKRWDGLVGKTIAAPVFAGIMDMYDARPVVDSKLFRMVNSFWKKNVTVFAPVAHMNNVMGNFVLAYAHDIPAKNIREGLRLTLIKNLNTAQLAQLGITKSARDNALLEEIQDAGIELVTFRYGDLDGETKEELSAAIKYVFNMKEQDSSKTSLGKMSIAMENVWAALKKADETFTKLYSEQDNIFRIAAYTTHLQNAMANGTKIDEAAKDKAGRFARSAFVDYDIKAPWVNALRHGKFGGIQLPFISWTYRMVPIMAKIAITKPWKLANLMAGVYALNTVFYAMLGGGGDDDERREKELTLVPDYWSKSMWGVGPAAFIRMPFGTEGSGYIYNLGNTVPLGNIFDWREGENLPGTLMPGGAGLTAIQAIFNYDFFRQKPIAPEFGGSQDFGGDVGGFLFSQLSPRVMVDAWRLGNDAIVDQKGALGQDPNRWVQLAKVMGFNVREVNWQEQEMFRSIELNKMRRDAKAAANKLMREYYRRGDEPDTAAMYEAVNEIFETLDKKTREKLGVE